MKSAVLVATGLMAICSTASAGAYLGVALGTEPALTGDVEKVKRVVPSGRSLRGIAGIRFGNVAVEGALNGFGVRTSGDDQNVYQASASLKLSLPLGDNFE